MKNQISRTATLSLYYNSLSSLSYTHQFEEMTGWLTELSKKINDWTNQDKRNYYYKAYVYAFEIDRVNVDVLADQKLLQNAERMWLEMKQEFSSSSSYSFICAFHILTKSLSRYYVDRVSMSVDSDTLNRYILSADNYFKIEKELNKLIVSYNEDEGWCNQAVMYHNLGFLYTKKGDYQRALESYEDALAIRRSIYGKERTKSNQDDIAETIVNIGALYFEKLRRNYTIEDFKKALNCAEEAIEIYKRNNDGSQYRETNYYKALLLKGTILFYFGLNNEDRKTGLMIVDEINKWDMGNPDNYYHGVIRDQVDGVEACLNRQ